MQGRQCQCPRSRGEPLLAADGGVPTYKYVRDEDRWSGLRATIRPHEAILLGTNH